MISPITYSILLVVFALRVGAEDLSAPIVSSDLVFEEKNGLVSFEAEHFTKQELTDKRSWYLTAKGRTPVFKPDGDPPHIGGASGGAYLEILPDSRRNHGEKLIHGENFSNQPGKLAILSYKVHFNTPGKYWIWARAYCTGSEDNGMHFGINGAWPPSAQRWQTVTRNQWHWKSAQRTEKVHVGVPGILTLDVPSAGEHTIQISMREDGIELDKILLVNRKEYEPKGLGPEPVLKAGKFPKAFEFVKAEPAPIPEKKRSARPDGPALVQPRQPDGDGTVKLSGELKAWHKVTLELSGPFGNEKDNQPNVFTDHDFTVTFRHSSGSPAYKVPGYFAADGDAANSSAESGTVWRAHLSPDKPGEWTYEVSFKRGPGAALGGKGKSLTPFDGKSGSFRVEASDKQAPDLRARGRLVSCALSSFKKRIR